MPPQSIKFFFMFVVDKEQCTGGGLKNLEPYVVTKFTTLPLTLSSNMGLVVVTQ
jgi:hypothetical protein